MRSGWWRVCGLLGLSILGLSCDSNAPGPDGPGGDGNVTNEERVADIEQAVQWVDSAMADDGTIDLAQVKQLLGGLRGVSETGEHDGGLFAKFADGEMLMIIDNRDATGDADDVPVDAAPANVAAKLKITAARLPTPPKAILLNGMGTFYTNTIPTFKSWLENAGYTVQTFEPTVDNLKGLSNIGLLYFSTHGIKVRGNDLPGREMTVVLDPDVNDPAPTITLATDGVDHFALWTTTKLTNDTITKYRALLHDGKLAYTVAKANRGTNGRPTLECHLAVTELFVVDPSIGWKFRNPSTAPLPDTMVYMDACSSADSRMQHACLSVGASYYLGWTTPTNDGDAAMTTKFLFDRLLGANSIGPFRNPPQRPFDLSFVFRAMRKVNRRNGQPMDTSVDIRNGEPDFNSVSTLVMRNKPRAPAGQLRPGIEYISADEVNERLILRGQFGDKAGKVFVGGNERALAGQGWKADKIECTLQRSDLGEVYVEVNGHKSNPRWLSAYDLVVTLHRVAAATTICSDCFWNMTWRGRLRIDLLQHRTEIENNPSPGGGGTEAVRGATFKLDSVTGQGSIGGSPFTLSKVNTSPVYLGDTGTGYGGGEWFSITGIFRMDQNKLVVNCHVDTAASRFTDLNSGQSDIQQITIHGSNPSLDHPFNLQIPLDGNYNFSAGDYTYSPAGATYHWNAANVISPPIKNAPI